MGTPQKSQDMPFGVGLLFAVIGAVIIVGIFWGVILPGFWVRFAYRPARAVVLETRETQRSAKGGTIHGLEARLGYSVAGRTYSRWLALPKNTRAREGPEVEAVRRQVEPGQRITCYYDPFDPASNVALDRNKLQWSTLFAPLFGLVFLVVGAAGMAVSWKKTFPRGPRVEVAAILSRLPGRFYQAVGGVLFLVFLEWLIIQYARPWLGGWLLLPMIFLAVALVTNLRLAAKYGSVAFPSPERRAALEAEATGPFGPKPIDRDPGPTIADKAIERVWLGAMLRYRLRGEPFGPEASDVAPGPLATTIFAPLLMLVFVSFVLILNRDRFPVRVLLPFLLILVVGVIASVWTRAYGRLSELTLEVSAYPPRVGETCHLALTHPDAGVLRDVRVELIGEESVTTTRGRGGDSTDRKKVCQVPVGIKNAEEGGGILGGAFVVPEGAMHEFATKSHRFGWALLVWLGPNSWAARFPLEIEPEIVADWRHSLKRKWLPTRIDEEPVSLWVDGKEPFQLPGGVLDGGYSIHASEEGALRTVELSVLWTIAGSGATETGVCHYEGHSAQEGDDACLYGTRTFRIFLPNRPWSYGGKTFQIRWLVRLRLRYEDGAEILKELPFQLGTAFRTE